VLNFLAKRGDLPRVADANVALGRLHETVKNDEKYQPQRFQAALGELKQTVLR